MPDILDGQSVPYQGSGKNPYQLKNVGGVYSCSCPAWRNQSLAIERRTCKHLKAYRGEAAELARVGAGPVVASSIPATTKATTAATTTKAKSGNFVMLAEVWSGNDPTGWWMSEKLDGLRAYWTGEKFVSRQGNEFYAPDWFIADLPKMPLDGELWLGRKAFQRTMSIVRRQDRSDQWKQIKYLVFDAPEHKGPFEQRFAELRTLFSKQLAYAALLSQEKCRDERHLVEELSRVEQLGGEGLMLREPGSSYVIGRSDVLQKVKTFFDAEAVVIDHQPGKGRHKGRLGAVLVRMPDGTEFAIGSGFTDAQRESPPKVGSVVTYKYQELTDGGVPRFPVFMRIHS